MGRLAPQGAVGLLGPMTGLGDDAACRSALQLDPAAPEVSLRYLQTVAIEALGASKLPDAVPVLNQLLLRTALFGSPQFHEQRPAVAQALAAHGSPAAKAALEAGRAHKNRSIRDACTAVAS
jgi:HEAT repeat protein